MSKEYNVDRENVVRAPRIAWRRTQVSPEILHTLTKSDILGWLQTGGHLAAFLTSGSLCWIVSNEGSWLYLAPLLLAHGVIASFLTNGIHELSHGTVFQTARLNRVFLHLFCWIRWINPYAFWASHSRHHRFTLHPPFDREVVLPTNFSLGFFLRRSLIDPLTMLDRFRLHSEYSLKIFSSDWDKEILSESAVAKRVAWWSRISIANHFGIFVISAVSGQWILPVLVSLTPAYAGGLFYLCNETQHAGMESETSDFRKSSRTIRLPPILERLYWRMNFHCEHHMFPSVPCYRLPKLHHQIEGDLPPTRGLIAAWREIFTKQSKAL